MIRQLRIRMTVLVITVLVLVSAGIVFSINYLNWRNIQSQVDSALNTLISNSGFRPAVRLQNPGEISSEPKPFGAEGKTVQDDTGIIEGTGPAEPAWEENTETKEGTDRPQLPGEGRSENGSDSRRRPSHAGQPEDAEDPLASLSNYYVVTLSSDDSVKSWTSDRSDLYSDEQIQEMTQLVTEGGKTSGRFGTQFYRLATINGQKQLIVLDERLDIMSARSVLRTTALIAAISCLLLCIAAVFLIRRMIRPVQESFDRQRQFVWDASHELKTPLAVIGANADVLQGEIGENEYLGYIRSEVTRTDKLVQNLLMLARMDQGTVKASLERIDLGRTVEGVALPFESTAFEEGKEFEIHIQDGVFCMGDASMLQQLTVILLGNAFKYSHSQGKIRIEVKPHGRGGEIRVANTGEGIAAKDLERIFDRFYRADTSRGRETEGYGLGLSIARKIVEEHHGKIRAQSDPEGETVFTVLLP